MDRHEQNLPHLRKHSHGLYAFRARRFGSRLCSMSLVTVLAVLFLNGVAQGFDSAAHRHRLLTNMTRYINVYPGNRYGYVPTNTMAFQEYALDFMLTLANDVNRKWRLGLPDPLTSDHVSEFGVLPKTNSFSAGIRVLGRYGFGFDDGRLENYRDVQYWGNAYECKPELFHQRATQPNHLTKSEALRLARDALHSLGLSEEELRIRKTPEMRQWECVPVGSTKPRPFPQYEIKWKYGYRKEPTWSAPVFMEVSGITKQIVAFECTSVNVPKIPLPTNYWQMLGLEPTRTNTPAKPGKP